MAQPREQCCLGRGTTTSRQQRGSPRPHGARVGNARMDARPRQLLLLSHAWDHASLPCQWSLLTRAPSGYTSSPPASCVIWAGISPEQDQARVPQIQINSFLPLRCHTSAQDTLHLPGICHYRSLSCFSVHQDRSGHVKSA